MTRLSYIALPCALALFTASSSVSAQQFAGPGVRPGAGCSGFGFGALSSGGRPVEHPHIVKVSPESPAEAAGLVVGDTVISVNGKDAMTTPGSFSFRADSLYVFDIRRGGMQKTVTMKAGKAEVEQAVAGSATPPNAKCVGTATQHSTAVTGVEGTFEFPQSVMSSPGGPSKPAVLRMIVKLSGDSVIANTQLMVDNRPIGKVEILRGTRHDNMLTLQSPMHEVSLVGAGDGRSIAVYEEYVLVVTADGISGDVSTVSTEASVQVQPRSLKGKRIS